MVEAASLIMSGLSLGATAAQFSWLHLRKVDSATGIVVASRPNSESAAFQFSFANLGTRPILLRSVGVVIYVQPDLHGFFMADHRPISGSLPQVIKQGEMVAVTIESRWTSMFFSEAAKRARERGQVDVSFFFVAQAVFWNPKGERLVSEQHIATLSANYENTQSKFELFPSPFRARKSQGCEHLRKKLHSILKWKFPLAFSR
jgi:hypothetical protein